MPKMTKFDETAARAEFRAIAGQLEAVGERARALGATLQSTPEWRAAQACSRKGDDIAAMQLVWWWSGLADETAKECEQSAASVRREARYTDATMAQKRRESRKRSGEIRTELAADRARVEKRLALEARGREGHRTGAAILRNLADDVSLEIPAMPRKKIRKVLRAFANWLQSLGPVAWPQRKAAA